MSARDDFIRDGAVVLHTRFSSSEIADIKRAAEGRVASATLASRDSVRDVLTCIEAAAGPSLGYLAPVNALGGAWHRDSGDFYSLPIRSRDFVILKLIVAEVDFTAANGATEFIPGTHLGEHLPRDGATLPLSRGLGTPRPPQGRQATMARGDVLAILVSHVYHRVAPGFRPERRSCSLRFCGRWRGVA